MYKILSAGVLATFLAGCATTGQVSTDTVVTTSPPRVIYVHPHDPWFRHHWHWGWHHRHGWGVHHPHFYHVPRHVHPHRSHGDQRRTIPAPVNPGNGSHIPRGEHLK